MEGEEIRLTGKQEFFCSHYVTCFSAHMASLLSGYKLQTEPGKSYFVYLLCNPESSSIFYVGKGKGKRPFHHAREKKHTGARINVKKHEAIDKIVKSGAEIQILYFAIDLKEKDAYRIEKLLIKRIGRQHLTNILSGFNKQTDADRARFMLNRVKKLSVFCAEDRKPEDVDLYFRIVSELKKIAA
jgi:hypothetical protein